MMRIKCLGIRSFGKLGGGERKMFGPKKIRSHEKEKKYPIKREKERERNAY